MAPPAHSPSRASTSMQLFTSQLLSKDWLSWHLLQPAAGATLCCLVSRGAPLSAGWLSEPHSTGGHTCVVCPYHGWAIDGEGKLQDVPSAEPGRWPKRPIVSSYPVSSNFWCSRSFSTSW